MSISDLITSLDIEEKA
jgi:hypothetical protein